MTKLHQALADRFGEHRVFALDSNPDLFPLLVIDLDLKSPVTLIMTNGLSDYKMPVPETLSGYEFNELFFCLPSYWDWKDAENDKMNWIFPWIDKLAKYVLEKNSWFGDGHTIPCGKDLKPLSTTMLQNHFFLSYPIYLEEALMPVVLPEKNIYFLAIIPIFADEMDYKQGKGTFKFKQKLVNKGVSEKLDDFRSTVLKSKWRLLRK